MFHVKHSDVDIFTYINVSRETLVFTNLQSINFVLNTTLSLQTSEIG